jgi:hypothetical protein
MVAASKDDDFIDVAWGTGMGGGIEAASEFVGMILLVDVAPVNDGRLGLSEAWMSVRLGDLVKMDVDRRFRDDSEGLSIVLWLGTVGAELKGADA